MSIVYAGIVPHSPLLISSIGKENLKHLKQTADSYTKIEEDIYSCQADTIIIISPHGPVQSSSFVMNLSPNFQGNFEEFGDFSTKVELNGNIDLAYKIRERMETRAPLQLISEQNLDYGTLVPAYLLTRNLPKIKIIPIYYSGLDLDAHFKFGQLLKRELLYNPNRVAVIASGDLSHRLNRKSPAGYSPRGKKFDSRLIEYLTKGKVDEVLKIEPKLSIDAGECGLRSVAILLGILDGINCRPQLLSYEFPFGVGYMLMKYELK